MKTIYAILQKTNDILLVAICLVVLLAVMIIALTNLWHYLLLCFPILLYLYRSKGITFMKNKHTKTGKKS